MFKRKMSHFSFFFFYQNREKQIYIFSDIFVFTEANKNTSEHYNKEQKEDEDEESKRKLIIIVSLSCIGGISLITIFMIYISRFKKSHWWKWNVGRPRSHSYHYKPSCSTEPPMTPNGNVFKQITPW